MPAKATNQVSKHLQSRKKKRRKRRSVPCFHMLRSRKESVEGARLQRGCSQLVLDATYTRRSKERFRGKEPREKIEPRIISQDQCAKDRNQIGKHESQAADILCPISHFLGKLTMREPLEILKRRQRRGDLALVHWESLKNNSGSKRGRSAEAAKRVAEDG